jgi:lipoic acid synthetase
VPPEEFAHWKNLGLSIGLGVVESGPLVRSSYHADEQSQKYTGVEHLNTANALAGA